MAGPEFNWDDDIFNDDTFIQTLDKLEELATSSSVTHHHPPPQQPPQQPPLISVASNVINTVTNDVSYSPPRELSQRPCRRHSLDDTTSDTQSVLSPVPPEQVEIEKLKSELSRASKQLVELREECTELKRERDKKKAKIVNVNVNSNAEANRWNSGAIVLDPSRSGIAHRCENAPPHHAASWINIEQKSIGVQTEQGDESLGASTSGATSTHHELQELVAVWSSRSSLRSRRKFVAKLLETCASDFCYLFGCLGLNTTVKREGEWKSLAALPGNVNGLHSAEVARISHLYSVLIKLSNEMLHIKALVEALLDLCSLDNALVVRRSLHILHGAVDLLLSTDRTLPRRDNVKVERGHSNAVDVHDSEVGKIGGKYNIFGDETSSSRYLGAGKHISIAEDENLSILSHVNWFDLFESLRQIAVRLREELARTEVVSIMNVILMRSNAYTERGKFGGSPVFKAMAMLLRKEAGLLVQKEAVHLVYLLLNCPNVLTTFCSSCKDAEGHMRSSNDGATNSAFQEYSGILEGLADCIVCSGCGEKGLDICRNAITVLAFLASSGRSGLEIFLFHKLSERGNFLGLILQILVSEVDADAFDSCSVPEISKERTLLIREALILLNRLASHPTYSATVMQVLSSNRDMISLAIDIATRLSMKSQRLLRCDSITRQMRESEVVNLAQVFKKRVFTFLGESTSS